MKALGFDGKLHNFNFTNKKRKGRSKLHGQVRETIKRIFPTRTFYEEVTLPGSKKGIRTSLLIADFFIPSLNMVVEAHGRQHYEYIPHFHGPKPQGIQNFVTGRQRDRDKIEWCEINDFVLVELPYNGEKEWEHLLTKN